MCVFVYFVLNKHRIINLHIYTLLVPASHRHRQGRHHSLSHNRFYNQLYQPAASQKERNPECIIKVENAYKYKCIKRCTWCAHLSLGSCARACKSATHSTIEQSWTTPPLLRLPKMHKRGGEMEAMGGKMVCPHFGVESF